MLGRVRERLRSDVPLTYGTILALNGVADGMWQGAYAWFLSARLGLAPTEIAVIIGAQFVLQIILEVPSGTWADRGNTRVIMAASYAAYLLYCVVYALSGTMPAGSSSALPLAIVAEACFGVGSALFSGTLDAWIAEKQRAAAADSGDFEKRLKKIHSISALWGQAPTALVGAFAFAFTTMKSAIWPWLIGGALYAAAGLIAIIAIPNRASEARATERSFAPGLSGRIKALLEDTGRHTGRALSYLQEKPSTLKLFLRASLAYMPFFATQVFWIPLHLVGGDAAVLGRPRRPWRSRRRSRTARSRSFITLHGVEHETWVGFEIPSRTVSAS